MDTFSNGTERPHLGIYDDCCGPHCDVRILHEPGKCDACDKFPVYQLARELWGIAYTRTSDQDPIPTCWLPDPAELCRPINAFSRWGGNKAQKDPFMAQIAQMLVGATDPEEIERAVDQLREVVRELKDHG